MKKRSFRRAVSIFSRDKGDKDQAEDRTCLLRYIQSRKWRKVRKFLKSSSREEISQITDISGISPIGACLGCNAPFDISEKILLFYPEAILIGDEYGSNPLHFACLNGSHPDLVEMILDQEYGKQAASQLDSQKYGPLHLAVDYACAHILDEKNSTEGSQSKCTNEDRIPSAWLHMNDDLYIDSIIRNSLRVIKMLCRVSPEIVFQEDEEGLTPLDIIQEKKLTIVNDVNYELVEEIYEELIDTAIKLYKERKSQWEDEGFDKARSRTRSEDEETVESDLSASAEAPQGDAKTCADQ